MEEPAGALLPVRRTLSGGRFYKYGGPPRADAGK